MVVYIYIQLCCGQSWGHLWLSTYISSNAMDNPGVIYGCLHIYSVMLWIILGSSMVLYIYIYIIAVAIQESSMVVCIYIQ